MDITGYSSDDDLSQAFCLFVEQIVCIKSWALRRTKAAMLKSWD
jgi:hypothetical protein